MRRKRREEGEEKVEENILDNKHWSVLQISTCTS